MSFFADRLQAIKPSPTLAVMGKAQQLKAKGEDILILAAGELDFETPEWIQHAAVQAMEQGLTRYTAVDGLPALKKAIQDKFQRQNSLNFNLDEIMVSSGGKQVLFNAMLATLNKDDEVIIPAPYWVSYIDVVALFDGKPVIVRTEENNHFKITPNQLEEAISDKTKWFILNSPSNPTGSIYTAAELKDLADVLQKYPHVHILSDDIYEHLTYDSPFCSILNVDKTLQNRTLILNGCSKAYAMTGWRIGYGAGPASLIKEMTKLQSQSTTSANSIAQGASVIALNTSLSFLNEWKKELIERRDFCVEQLNNIKGLRCIKPEGAFYIYINCEQFIGKCTITGEILESDNMICEYLLKFGVAVVPGSAFGLSPYFRISFATSMEDLEKAMNRLRKAFSSIL
jgi:aspartate aminotransferase